jgi:adenylyl-sulfate kinase
VEQGLPAYLLDGDELRHGICGDLAFGRADREENVRRVGELARLFADSGVIAIAAVVSPYEHTRREVRERHERDGLPFFEVFVDTPVAICAQRDPKGLYARALAGELTGMTGIDDPYEPPGFPDLHLTPQLTVAGAVNAVLELLPVQGADEGASEAPGRGGYEPLARRREVPRARSIPSSTSCNPNRNSSSSGTLVSSSAAATVAG